MIPDAKLDDVKKALQSTFGVTTYDDIKKLTTGLSNALVLRIVVHGKRYLLKIARTDLLSDSTLYYYTCMKSAAEAGIAPKVWYAGIKDEISITDFVEVKFFPLSEAKTKLADVIYKLHSLSPFSKTIHSIDTANRFVQRLQTSNILPRRATEEIISLFEQIQYVYPRTAEDLVPSHNDLKPENILFDGTTAWLSDWEAAFTNDRYSDLAIVANFVVTHEADETEFLSRYFKREATEYELARFFLMRQIMHISYFTVFMTIVAAKGKPIDLNSIPTYDFRDFHHRMWEGKIDLATNEPRLEYAKVHMEQLLYNVRLDRFNDALKIVSMAKQSTK